MSASWIKKLPKALRALLAEVMPIIQLCIGRQLSVNSKLSKVQRCVSEIRPSQISILSVDKKIVMNQAVNMFMSAVKLGSLTCFPFNI